MIPVKLRLRNFMCYRENVPVLNLEGLRIVCLCGDNGAGKSALLDSITWCLWGKARTRSDDDLIHIGRDEMEVELEFLMLKSLYRVVRKRNRTMGKRPGKTILELHVSTGTSFEPISGAVRETQAKINEVLRMDYDTFINSAFLLQGRADEFTLKSADKRKEVLSEILNLRYYDTLEERAREQSRTLRAEQAALDLSLGEITAELARRDEYQQAFDVANTRVSELARRRQELESEAQRLRLEKQALDLRARERHKEEARIAQMEAEAGRWRQQAEEAAKEIQECGVVLADVESIQAGYRRFVDTQKAKEHFDRHAHTFYDLSHRKLALENAVKDMQSKLRADRQVAAAGVDGLKQRSAGYPQTEQALAAAEDHVTALDANQARLDAMQREMGTNGEAVADKEAVNRRLKADMEELRERMTQLEAGQGTCPLCGTDLGQDRCEGVLSQYQADGETMKRQFIDNQSFIATLRERQAAFQGETQSLQATLRREQPIAQGQVGTLRQALSQAALAREDLPAAEQALTAMDRQLSENGAASEQQLQLDGIGKDIVALGYDKDAHDQTNADWEGLRTFDDRHRRLEEAQRREPLARQRAKDAKQALEAREAERASGQALLKALGQEVNKLPEVTSALEDTERTLRSVATEEEQARQAVGATQGNLARLADRETAHREKKQALQHVLEEQSIYDDLVRAFGRKGIQALIIESALPDMEEEANRLLARMTDNRMHLKLESQSSYRSKEGVQETLEIRIADELGTRSYETFSGGEAFRINLALRIALSKMLARRAGAPLPTLFIDEGFGTQDPGGRDKIVEAINAIQDDFERIIIITHIEELKEQFPARIEVTKTPNGSTFVLT